MEAMSVGDDLLDERWRRRAGDPRLSDSDRKILVRLVKGDLVNEFQAGLDSISSGDPILSGQDLPDV